MVALTMTKGRGRGRGLGRGLGLGQAGYRSRTPEKRWETNQTDLWGSPKWRSRVNLENPLRVTCIRYSVGVSRAVASVQGPEY